MSELRREDLEYPLDPARIATEPAAPRDSARLMVVHRDRVEHRQVRDLAEYLEPGDLMVVNATTVEPRRVVLARESGGRLEGLLLEPLGERRWLAMLKGARRVAVGDRLALIGLEEETGANLRAVERREDRWVVAFEGEADERSLLEEAGRTPLPPYILKARRDREGGMAPEAEDRLDRARYQTIYAHREAAASVAAPTAGLHFTPDLLAAVEARGVDRLEVELQVGPGTFRNVETERVSEHRMDLEGFRIPPEGVKMLLEQCSRRQQGRGRLLAVGSTSVRTLESLRVAEVEEAAGEGRAIERRTDLLLVPGMPVRWCDLLLTNFHLPGSTLVALLGAFIGLERVRALYALAHELEYRFFSYGDAMLVLPEAVIAPRDSAPPSERESDITSVS